MNASLPIFVFMESAVSSMRTVTKTHTHARRQTSTPSSQLNQPSNKAGTVWRRRGKLSLSLYPAITHDKAHYLASTAGSQCSVPRKYINFWRRVVMWISRLAMTQTTTPTPLPRAGGGQQSLRPCRRIWQHSCQATRTFILTAITVKICIHNGGLFNSEDQ